MGAPCKSAVVKLGGGLITDRSRPETVDENMLRLAARQLAEYVSSGGRIVAVVHGGGSFGHYRVAEALRGRDSLVPSDAPAIQYSMQLLSLRVAEALLDSGLKPSIHAPHTFCLRPGKCWYDVLARDYALGLTPVTYGDVVPDGLKLVVVSGDVLAANIAEALKAECLVYATRVPGVLDDEGRVVRVVNTAAIAGLSVEGYNVTGGMKAKVEAALRASIAVPRVVIVGGENLYRALMGEEVGTLVKP